MDDLAFMKAALEQAQLALSLGEVPVGAVIVQHGEIIARGCNRRECDKNALAHAETRAIDEACRALGGWRLQDCTLYVTLEPCPMCSGAIINSRISRVVYGAAEPKTGCAGSVINMFEMPFNHRPILKGGVLREECTALLERFFSTLR